MKPVDHAEASSHFIQATRHIEILEFLFETIVRLQSVEGRPSWQS